MLAAMFREEMPARVGRNWIWPDGTRLPVVAGAEGEPTPPTPPADPPPPPSPPADPPPPAGPTAADRKRIAAEAEADLLKKLGVDKLEDAQTVLTAVKAAEDATKSQAQRDAESAAREKAEAAAERQAARRERQEGWVELELVAAGLLNGIPEDKGDLRDRRLKREAKALLVDLKDDADRDAVKAAVEQLKKDDPDLFAASTPATPRVPRHQPGSHPATTKGSSERDRSQAGAERARAERAAQGADQHPAASLISRSPWDTAPANPAADPAASLRS